MRERPGVILACRKRAERKLAALRARGARGRAIGRAIGRQEQRVLRKMALEIRRREEAAA